MPCYKSGVAIASNGPHASSFDLVYSNWAPMGGSEGRGAWPGQNNKGMLWLSASLFPKDE
jgi:hypothetical protein